MTETGWIIVGVIVVIAIILVVATLRRRPDDALSAAPAPTGELLPEQVTPEPLHPHPHPQTIDAEPVIPAPAVVEPTVDIPPVQVEAAAVVPEGEPAPLAPVPEVVTAPASGEDDNLLKLKGVGPKIAAVLKAEGVTRYAQIAAWSDADLAAIDAKLGSFAGRPKRDNWVDQASFLAAGDVAGYEAKYGKL